MIFFRSFTVNKKSRSSLNDYSVDKSGYYWGANFLSCEKQIRRAKVFFLYKNLYFYCKWTGMMPAGKGLVVKLKRRPAFSCRDGWWRRRKFDIQISGSQWATRPRAALLRCGGKAGHVFFFFFLSAEAFLCSWILRLVLFSIVLGGHQWRARHWPYWYLPWWQWPPTGQDQCLL